MEDFLLPVGQATTTRRPLIREELRRHALAKLHVERLALPEIVTDLIKPVS